MEQLPSQSFEPIRRGDAQRPENILNLNEIESHAKHLLSPKALAYYWSASDDQFTKNHNSSIFNQIYLRPRIFHNVTHCSLASSILGHNTSLPIFVSPTAMSGLAHHSAECGIRSACEKYGAMQIVSNHSSKTPEEIVAEAPKDQALGWQLYVQTERVKSEDMLARIARLPNFRFIVLTLDAPVPGKREADERAHQVSEDSPGPSREETGGKRATSSTNANCASQKHSEEHSGTSIGLKLFSGTAANLTWEETLPWLIKHTNQPIVLKGIITWEDAYLAWRFAKMFPQVRGIILSNHGGRSADTAPPPVLVLLEIRKHCPQVMNDLEILMDSGFRRGTDVVKALALGAKGIGLGRPALYGLAVSGSLGVERVLEILKAEVDNACRLLGVENVKELGLKHINTRKLDVEVWDGDTKESLQELDEQVERHVRALKA